MLFGSCAQEAAASFLPFTNSLCSGGAGFVTAMMATLAANARTAPAKTLGRAVPEVDRLAVRMVTFSSSSPRRAMVLVSSDAPAPILRSIGLRVPRSTASGGSPCTPNPNAVPKRAM
jgi:hypothetical protein